jgi:plasmid stability protein
MTLTIELPEQVEKRLAEQAARDGKSTEKLASELIERAMAPAREKSFAEIAAPFAQEFAESGMSEEELDALVEKTRQEIWEEKHGKKS